MHLKYRDRERKKLKTCINIMFPSVPFFFTASMHDQHHYAFMRVEDIKKI